MPKKADKEDKPKKKLIVVDAAGRNSASNIYGSSGIRFALVSSPENGRKQATDWFTCRDYFGDIVKGFVLGSDKAYGEGKTPYIDMDKMRLLIHRSFGSGHEGEVNEEFRNKLFSGKAAINLYEKLAGWKESKITTVNHSTVGKQAWLITGPKEWIRVPHTTSMLILIMRIAANHGPLKADSLEELNKCWSSLATKDGGSFYDTNHWLRKCWQKFDLVMKHYDELFDLPMKDLYSHGHGRGGIYNLCQFSTGIETLDKKFRKVCEERIEQ